MTGQKLWSEADQPMSLNEALDSLFLDTPYRQLAQEVFHWLQERIPYKSGVRLGKNRITFLIGNYRPAALKIDAGELVLYMVFAGSPPHSFELTYRFASIDVNEGRTLIDSLGHVLSSGVNCRRDSPRNRGSLVLLGKLVLTVFGAAHGAYEVIRHRPTVSSGGRRRLGATLGAPCRRRRCAACA